MKNYWFIIVVIPFLMVGQNNQLQGFENLVDKTWRADGEWSNGSKFKQEVSYTFKLNKSIVVTDSKGFTNQEQTDFGYRNRGIRQYNVKEDKIKFWEFDVFGGVTEGFVRIEDKNVWYQYKYGETTVTDCWEYVDDSTYKFTVGTYKDEEWKEVYLQTEFKLKNN